MKSNLKSKILRAARSVSVLLLLVAIGYGSASLASSPTAYAKADTGSDCDVRQTCEPGQGQNCTGGIHVCNDQYVITCQTAKDCNIVQKYVNPAIRALELLVGIAVVAGIIMGAIRYMMSAGEPQKAQQAKELIRNSVIALLAYLFLYAMLRFLFPGDYFIV
jgi:hypothetical protein